jgi:hypothetical protein
MGMQRSTAHAMSQGSIPSIVKTEGDVSGSDHDGEKTNPATPVKASTEDAASSSHGSARHD